MKKPRARSTQASGLDFQVNQVNKARTEQMEGSCLPGWLPLRVLQGRYTKSGEALCKDGSWERVAPCTGGFVSPNLSTPWEWEGGMILLLLRA